MKGSHSDILATDAATARQARVAKALGHPARLAIVGLLAGRGSCICGDIVDELPYAQSTVSAHLAVLKDAGLIVGQIDGPRVCYCLDVLALQAFVEATAALVQVAINNDPSATCGPAGCGPTSAMKTTTTTTAAAPSQAKTKKKAQVS